MYLYQIKTEGNSVSAEINESMSNLDPVTLALYANNRSRILKILLSYYVILKII